MLEKGSEVAPDDMLNPYLTALSYNKMGDEGKAVELLKAALTKAPKIMEKAEGYNTKFLRGSDPGDFKGLLKKAEPEKKPEPEPKPKKKAGHAEKAEKPVPVEKAVPGEADKK